MKRGRFKHICLAAMIIMTVSIFVGCNNEIEEVRPAVTPGITGSVSIPSGSSVGADDISILIVSGGTAVGTYPVSSDGTFLIKDLPSGEYDMYFSSEMPSSSRSTAKRGVSGYGGWLGNIVSVPDVKQVVGIVPMKPLGTLRGKAEVAGRNDGNDVRVFIPGTSYIAITDSTGAFEITGVPQGSHMLRFTLDGYAPVDTGKFTLFSDDGNEPSVDIPAVLMLPSTGRIAGTVRLSGRTDSSDITVSLEDLEGNAVRQTVTGTDGIYAIGEVEPGRWKLSYMKDGFNTIRSGEFSVSAGRETSMPEIFLESLKGSVGGILTLETGEPASGAIVLMKSRGGIHQETAISSGDGTYSFGRTEPGIYDFIISMPGFRSVEIKDFTVRGAVSNTVPTQVMRSADKSITGKVVLEGREDFSGTTMTATDMDSPEKVMIAVTDVAGRYAFYGLSDGRYMITASRYGYETVVADEITLKNGEAVEASILTLHETKGIITGTVKLEGREKDASGVRVELMDTGDFTFTDKSGNFTLEVPSGSYENGIAFTHDYYFQETFDQRISVLDMGSFLIPEVSMKAGFSDVSGTVTIPGAASAAGVSVTLGTAQTVTDAAGRYAFEKIPLGEQKIIFIDENCAGHSIVVDVVPSSVFNVGNVRLSPKFASVYGTVQVEKMNDSSSVNVAVVMNGKIHDSTVTGPDGSFSFEKLTAGQDYTVTFSKNGFSGGEDILISGLVPFEKRNITPSPHIIRDIDAPYHFVVNVKPSESEGKVRIILDSDSGTPYTFIKISETEDFKSSETLIYRNSAEWTVPENGDGKTFWLTVTDAAGNESYPVSFKVDIGLFSECTMVEGSLDYEGGFHWTKKESPYVVVGDIMTATGTKIVIDPGVTVLFAGDYRIYADISAEGTENESISFRSAGRELEHLGIVYEGKWTNIRGYEIVMKHCSVSDCTGGDYTDKGGVTASRGYLEDCVFESSGTAVCISSGNALRITVQGGADLESVTDSRFIGNDMTAKDPVKLDYALNCSFSCIDAAAYSFTDCTLEKCRISGEFHDSLIIDPIETVEVRDRIEGCVFSGNLPSPLVKAANDVIYADNNWWGDANTEELRTMGNIAAGNPTFILDNRDDPSLPRFVVTSYADAPLPGAGTGVKEKAFNAEYDWKNLVPGLPIGMLVTEGNPYEVRSASSVSALTGMPWTRTQGKFYCSDADPDVTDENGRVAVYMQFRDENGHESGVRMVTVPYQTPYIVRFPIEDGIVFSTDYEYVDLDTNFEAMSSGESITEPLKWYVDGEEIWRTLVPGGWKNGEHELRAVVTWKGQEWNFSRRFSSHFKDPSTSFSIFDTGIHSANFQMLALDDVSRYSDITMIVDGQRVPGVRRGGAVTVPYPFMPAGTDMTVIAELKLLDGTVITGGETKITIEGDGKSHEAVFDFGGIDGTKITLDQDQPVRIEVTAPRYIRELVISLDGKIMDEYQDSYFEADPGHDFTSHVTEFSVPVSEMAPGLHELKAELTDQGGRQTVGKATFSVELPSPVTVAMREEYDRYLFSWDTRRNYKSKGLVYGGKPIASAYDYVDGRSVLILKKDTLPSGEWPIRFSMTFSSGNEYISEPFILNIPERQNSGWGQGMTWNSDGTFIADGITRVLIDFDRMGNILTEETGRLSFSPSNPGVPADGIFGNAVRGAFDAALTGPVKLIDGCWTLEYWVKQADPAQTTFAEVSLLRESGKDPISADYYGRQESGWHYIALVSDGKDVTTYRDGLPVEYRPLTDAEAGPLSLSGIGIRIPDEQQQQFLDELRFTAGAKGPDEIFGYWKYVDSMKGGKR